MSKESSPHFPKIRSIIGDATESLATLASEVAGGAPPFDLVIIDADKANSRSYFDFVLGSGLLAKQGTVCIDTMAHKAPNNLRALGSEQRAEGSEWRAEGSEQRA